MAALLLQITFGGVGAGSPIINSGPPPPGQVGIAYAWTASAAGGKLPYAWSVSSGTLATGLSLNSATGIVSGTPSAAGSFSFSLLVTDANGNPSTPAPFMITVTSQVTITNGAPPNGVVSTPYSFIFTAAGGTPPYIWSIATGSIAACGLSLSSAGSLTGTPGSATSCTFTVRATDIGGQTATSPSYTISITGSAPTCGPPNYSCSSRSTAMIQNPPPPFIGPTGVNTIACDPSINGACNSTSGTDPIMRASDQTTFTQWSCDVSPSGGENDNLFNVGNTRVIFTCIKTSLSTTFVALFNPTTMQVSSVTALPATLGFPTWSRTNPDILYTSRLNGNIDQYTFNPGLNTFVQTTIFNTLTSCSGLSTLLGTTSFASAGPLSVDSSDTFFQVVATSSGQQSTGWVILYDKGTNKCSFLDTNTGNITLENNSVAPAVPINSPNVCWPIGLHAGYVQRSATYARWSEAATTQCPSSGNQNNTAWQIGTRNITACDNSVSLSCSPNHNTDGWLVEVFTPVITGVAGGFPVTIHFQWSDTLPPPTSQYYQPLLAKRDDEHITSFGNSAAIDTNPILASTFLVLWDGTPFIYPGEFEMQAFTRSPLQSAPIVRFAHNFTSGSRLCPKCDFRDQNAIGAASQDGKFLMFVSDMLLTLGTDAAGNPRQDVFIMRLD